MKRAILLMVCLCILGLPLRAQEKPQPAEDPAHAQLRTLKKDIKEAWNKRDIDRLLSYCHKDVVITWQNAEVSVGHEQVREYYNRMMSGPNSVVESIEVDLEPDDLSKLHGGDTAISWGNLNDRYKLRDGMQIAMNSRWSASLVKDGDRWKIASYHASTNVFDSEVLREAVKKTLFLSGGIALAVGLVLGGGMGFFLGKRRKA